ncbi:hypothetical protein ABEF91_006876 [Exophiala dermatitidis]
MSDLRRILITGATGKQGGAVLRALLKSPPSPPFHLVALTRNAKSESAQALTRNNPNVSLLEGNLDDCKAIFRASSETDTPPFYGVFSVQVPLKPRVEEQQGKDLIDAAAAHGVRHFVYTSADRGGTKRSDRDATAVKHFASKFAIETHLKHTAQKLDGRMKWTIVRPVAFMENLTPDFLGRAFATMWQLNGMDDDTSSKLQLVSATDVGILAADAFKHPETYAGRAISIATDELTARQANDVFKRVVGSDMPTTYPFVGRLIKLILREQLGVMFDWFKTDGFGADPNEWKDKFPEMQDFERWLRESSRFDKKT